METNNSSEKFNFFILVIAVSVLAVLFVIIVYVWIVDYFIKDVKTITKISSVKKIKRKNSVQELPKPKLEQGPLPLHSKSTGTRMTVYP